MEKKIQIAVDTCLATAAWAERPFLHVRTFIDLLKGDKSWTPHEVNEVQTRAVRGLIQLQKLKQSAS